ncbi:hypothetical protein ADK38_25930, partial [Streptomyces varsoviensis]
AAAVLRAAALRQATGGSYLARLALAQTASWLINDLKPDAGEPTGTYEPTPWLTEGDGPLGHVRYALPPVSFDGGPRDFPSLPGLWGTDKPAWR